MPRRQTTRYATHQTASQTACPANPRRYCAGVTAAPVSTSTGNDRTYGNHRTPATRATAGGRSESGAKRPDGAPVRRVDVPVGALGAALAPASGRRPSRGRPVVPVRPVVPGRGAHGSGRDARAIPPWVRRAGRLARGLVGGVSRRLAPRHSALRGGGWMSVGRVLGALWRVNVVEEVQYRANFLASLLGTLFWIAMALLTLALFFGHTARLGGWDYWEVVVLLGVFNALTGVIEAVLRPGVGELADIVLGLGLAGYALVRLGRVPSLLDLVAFAVTLAAAVAVVYAIWVALMSLAFWFVAVENLSVLFDAVYEAARYPVSAYPGALRFVFVYLVPIAWTTTIPASAHTGRLGGATALGAAGVGALALVLTRILWRAALRRYTSAGG